MTKKGEVLSPVALSAEQRASEAAIQNAALKNLLLVLAYRNGGSLSVSDYELNVLLKQGYAASVPVAWAEDNRVAVKKGG